MAEPAAAEGARALALLRVGAPREALEAADATRDDRANDDAESGQEAGATKRVLVEATGLSGGNDALGGPLDVERARVKLEAARARLSGPWYEIPAGRVYDSPPDGTEEEDYDALEMAYNQAFCATSATRLERCERPSRAGEAATASSHVVAADSTSNGQGPTSSAVLGSSSVEIEKPSPPSSAPARPASPQQAAEGTHEQPVKGEGPSSAKTPPDGDVCMEENQQMADGEADANRTAADGVRADANTPTVQSPASPPRRDETNTLAGSTEEPTTPPEAKELVKHDGVATIDPSTDQRASSEGSTMSAVRGDENQALNGFLVAELQLFAGQLLGHGSLMTTSTDHDIAHVTSLQLFHNHQRAIMDFDAESKRYYSWSKPRASSSQVAASDSPIVETPTVLCPNPFQNVQSEEARWTNLLKHIRPLSRSDSEESPSTPHEWATKPVFMRAFQFHTNGLNAVTLKHGDGNRERGSVAALLAQLARVEPLPCMHLIVCASSDVHVWQESLCSSESLQICPCWGPPNDRQRVIKSLNEQYERDGLKSQVVVASFEAFAEDTEALSLLPFRLVAVDMPDTQRDRIDAKWPCVLSQRCRQRILMCSHDLVVDARRLLHFVLPGLFSSRRKFLAWNYAALDASQIQAVCRVIEELTILSEDDAVRRFIDHLATVTQENSEHELATLGMLNKQGIVRPVAPMIKLQSKPSVLKKIRNRAIGLTPAKAKKIPDSAAGSPTGSQPPKFVVKKRRGSDSERHSRKRITRCGKCSGCLSEDCMVCGHCKDMKKYGGPGLRKQSCKNRKCLEPKSWGLSSKRRRRSKLGSAKAGADDLTSSMNDDSDMYYDPDDISAYSSIDSDRESLHSSLRLSMRDGADSDSDGGASSRLSDDGSLDSPRGMNLLLPASDTVLDDNLSLSDLSVRSNPRSRVVRCGKCDGCTATDCMNCRHCRDMKKYGGPGLRKQSCKNRKCIAPKIVELNQDGADEYIDEKGNIIPAELLEAPEFSDHPSDSTGPGTPKSPPVEDRSKYLSVVQRCAIFVEPRLVFQCSVCTARFCSKPFLDFHKRVEHQQPSKAGDAGDRALDLQASRLFLHPITQNAIVASQLRQQDRSQRACPLGYAKLESSDFQYFFIEPYVVLGRLQPYWRELYKDLGVRDLKGLPGGAVDCHLGNDHTITEQHALISWDAQLGRFVISCLSAHSSITVDGQEVGLSSPPVPLRSRALVQVGASSFFFLLPLSESGRSTSRRPRTPLEDVRSWAHAAVERRRAKRASLPSITVEQQATPEP